MGLKGKLIGVGEIKKKILFMVGMMNVGGVEKSLLSLLSVIPKNKYQITVLMLEKKGGFLKYIPDWVLVEEASWFNEIKPIILQPPQYTVKDYFKKGKYSKILSFVATYLVSKRFDQRHLYYKQVLNDVPKHLTKYDVAIAYQGPNDVIDYYITNKVRAAKKVSWVHFDVSQFGMNKKLYHKLYRKYDKVYVVSQQAEKRLQERIPITQNKSKVFMNIIAKEQIRKLAKQKVEFDKDYKGLKIVTTGRLSKEKGQDLAINVLSRLRNEGYEVRWYCIGEGSQRKEYERLIEAKGLVDDFILMGEIQNPYPFILKSDIYVQPSRHEGFCLTLAEAKCLNKPIVTTDFIGAYEQIINGHNGVIVRFDEQQLYEEIKNLIESPKKCDDLIKNLSDTNIDSTEDVRELLDYFER